MHDANFWQSQRRKFLQRADSIFQRVIAGTTLDRQIADSLQASRRIARWQLLAVFAAIAGGVALMVMKLPVFGGACMAAGVFVFLVLHLLSARRFSRAQQAFARSISGGSIELRRQLGERVSEETQEFFENFGKALLPFSNRIAEQEKHHAAQHLRIEELSATFESLDREVNAGGAAGPA